MDFSGDPNAARMLNIVKDCLRRHDTRSLAQRTLQELAGTLNQSQCNAYRLAAMYLVNKYERNKAQAILTWPLTGTWEEAGVEASEIGETARREVVMAIAEGARKLIIADAVAIRELALDALVEPTW